MGKRLFEAMHGHCVVKNRFVAAVTFDTERPNGTIHRYDKRDGTIISRTYWLRQGDKQRFTNRVNRIAEMMKIDVTAKGTGLWNAFVKRESEVEHAIESTLWSTEKLERLARGE